MQAYISNIHAVSGPSLDNMQPFTPDPGLPNNPCSSVLRPRFEAILEALVEMRRRLSGPTPSLRSYSAPPPVILLGGGAAGRG